MPKLFSTVIVPPEVLAELSRPGAPPIVASWARQPPGWITVTPVKRLLTVPVDAGEVAALSLAVELGHKEILLDDGRAREIALHLGLNPLGTLRVLELAAEFKLIDMHAALSDLEKSNFRVHPRFLATLRAKFPK